MPSTFSPNLALELMATGEDSGTWGTKTNNNLSPLIEEAIVGEATVTFADADQAISMLNGVDCAARNLVLNLDGANTAQRTLTVPTLHKTYVVYHNVTGGFGINVTTSGGTGVVVPPGSKTFLYVDGTNVTNLFDSFPQVNFTGSTSGLTKVQASATASGTLTLPAATDTLVARATTDTLTNKTLTNCVANTQTAGDNSTKLATTAYVDAAIGTALPPGVMMPYSVPSAPTGWLLANGQAVSRTTYANLFTAIGTTFGSGDGSTTFNLPDMRGRTAAGSDTMGTSAAGRLGSGPTGGFTGSAVNIGTVGGEQGHSLAADENAAHAHGVNDPWHSHGVGDPGHTHFAQNQVYVGGNFNGGPNPVNTGGSNVNGAFTGISIAANPTGISIQNSGSGNAHNTVQPTMISYWLIKF